MIIIKKQSDKLRTWFSACQLVDGIRTGDVCGTTRVDHLTDRAD